ncbi:phosphate metabolism protein 7 [Coemansia sp. RSA 1933]|nr:phosphate metabolism protein 7 [Coemansia sp. RSA 1933]
MASFQDLLENTTSSSDDGTDTSNSVETFVSSVGINMGLALVLFLAFSVLRPRLRRVYAPRTYAVEKARRSEPVGTGLLAWIPASLRVPDHEVIRRVGLDTYMFLRTVRTMFLLFLIIAVLTALSVLPVNILGSQNQRGLNALSMGNVDAQSPWLWVHVAAFAGAVLWTLRTIVGELRIYTRLRIWWLTHPDNADRAGARTILVSNIPDHMVHRERRLHEVFEQFPGGVRQIFVNRTSKTLAATVKRRTKLIAALEKTLARYAVACTRATSEEGAKMPLSPTIRKSLLGERVDAVKYYATEILQCNREIGAADRDAMKRQPAALVMFNRVVAAHMAAQTVLDHRAFSLSQVSVDVQPDDIVWSSLAMRPWDRRIRGYVSFAATVALTAVWTLVTAFLSGLVQVKTLARLKAFAWLQGNAWAFGVFSGTVPAAVLALLMLALPVVLRLLLRAEGTARRSLIDLRLLHRLFFFQVWNVYAVAIFSSSLLTIAAQAIGQPKTIITLVQTQVPQSATNILTYVVLLSFLGAAKEALQGVRLAMRYIVPLVRAKTPRSLVKAEEPRAFSWAEQIPTQSLVFLMGLSYAVVAPIVAWFAMTYYGLFYLIYRYQFLYVYNDRRWTTGGLAFPRALQQMLAAVYVSEAFMVLMMVARLNATPQAILRVVATGAVLAITVAVHLYINDVYMPATRFLPVRTAADAARVPHGASDFPIVLSGRTKGAMSPARNRAHAAYGSLVPAWMIDAVLWMAPPPEADDQSARANVWDRQQMEGEGKGEEEEEDAETLNPHRSSMADRRPQASLDDNELAREFADPAMRATPMCKLWVPPGNSRMFGRLVDDIQRYGKGTIQVITQGTWIDPKSLAVRADFDVFDSAISEH